MESLRRPPEEKKTQLAGCVSDDGHQSRLGARQIVSECGPISADSALAEPSLINKQQRAAALPPSAVASAALQQCPQPLLIEYGRPRGLPSQRHYTTVGITFPSHFSILCFCFESAEAFLIHLQRQRRSLKTRAHVGPHTAKNLVGYNKPSNSCMFWLDNQLDGRRSTRPRLASVVRLRAIFSFRRLDKTTNNRPGHSLQFSTKKKSEAIFIYFGSHFLQQLK